MRHLMKMYSVEYTTDDYGNGVATIAAPNPDRAVDILKRGGYLNSESSQYKVLNCVEILDRSLFFVPTILYEKFTSLHLYKGEKGDPGEQGVSVSSVEQTYVSVESSGTNIITVVLSDGRSFTFSVRNGAKGEKGNDGISTKEGIISVLGYVPEDSALAYEKPSSGIPYDDLSSAVRKLLDSAGTSVQPQSLLEYRKSFDQDIVDSLLDFRISSIESLESTWNSKQDAISDLASIRSGAKLGSTALQSFTETDPVFKASASYRISSSDISSWNSRYEKPSDGIPSTDLEQSVQDALGKAHEHSNKSVLDSITEAKVLSWDEVGNKVDKENGKGLSTNDYTDGDKEKLSGLENYDDAGIRAEIAKMLPLTGGTMAGDITLGGYKLIGATDATFINFLANGNIRFEAPCNTNDLVYFTFGKAGINLGNGTIAIIGVTDHATLKSYIDMTTHQVKNLAEPTDDADAVTKSYVDTMKSKVDTLWEDYQGMLDLL